MSASISVNLVQVVLFFTTLISDGDIERTRNSEVGSRYTSFRSPANFNLSKRHIFNFSKKHLVTKHFILVHENVRHRCQRKRRLKVNSCSFSLYAIMAQEYPLLTSDC